MGNLMCCFRAPSSRSVLPDSRLDGRVALVTGASLGGLGYSIARELARRGARVVMAGRDDARVAAAAEAIRRTAQREGWSTPPLLSALQMDLSSLESIAQCVTTQLPSLSPPLRSLHILIHNAGTLAPTAKASFNTAGVETTVATNYLGPAMLTELLRPMMERTTEEERRRAADEEQRGRSSSNNSSGSGGEEKERRAAADPPYIARVIHLSSLAHTFSSLPDRPTRAHVRSILRPSAAYFDSWDAYAHSKLLQLLHARSLASSCDPHAPELLAFAVHPGVVRTRMGRDSCAYSTLCCAVGPCCFRNADQGAAPVIMLCLAPSAELEQHSGEYFTSASTEPIAPARVAAAVREPRLAEIVASVTAEEIAAFEQQQRFARSAAAASALSIAAPSIAVASSAPPPVSNEKDRLISASRGSHGGGEEDRLEDLDLEAEVSQWTAHPRADEMPITMGALDEETFENALREH